MPPTTQVRLDRLPKRHDTGEPLRRFRLLAGVHCDAGGVHKRGDIVHSEFDLVALHGRERFQPLFHYGTEAQEQEPTLYETEVGSETADEIAARVRAQVLSEMKMPRQCTKFGDCLRPDGHDGECAFARHQVTDKGDLVVNQTKPVSKPAPTKTSPAKPVSNTGPAPKVETNKTKSPTSAYDSYNDEELKSFAADEEVDISACKTREEVIKTLQSAIK